MGSFILPRGAKGMALSRSIGVGATKGARGEAYRRSIGAGKVSTPPRAPAPTPATAGAGGATAVAGGSDIMDLYKQALERLSTGGLSLEASLADIEAGKQQAIARGQQSMVSGGLGGTTVMGGVPIAAEKTAGRARLAARGEAESKYLGALTSYAGFAQQAQQATAERQAAMERLQMQISSQERLSGMQIGAQERLTELSRPTPISRSEVGGPTYMAKMAQMNQPSAPSTYQPPGAGYYGNYSQQFPSIYDQQQEESVPQWT